MSERCIFCYREYQSAHVCHDCREKGRIINAAKHEKWLAQHIDEIENSMRRDNSIQDEHIDYIILCLKGYRP